MFLFEVNSIKKWGSIRFIIQSACGAIIVSVHTFARAREERKLFPRLFSHLDIWVYFSVYRSIADEVPEVHLSSSNLQLFLIFL